MSIFLRKVFRRAKYEVNAQLAKLVGRHVTFVTIKEMKEWIEAWKLPNIYELIVGIPRSGVPLACHIAEKFGVSFSTPTLTLKNQGFKPSDLLSDELLNQVRLGKTGDEIEAFLLTQKQEKTSTENMLLVDDSLNTGQTLEKNLNRLMENFPNSTIGTAALIVTKEYKHAVDYHYKALDRDRLFEWALIYADVGKLVADMDGVLCENCTSLENYPEWLTKAKPKTIPKRRIDTIVTARKEEFRNVTEQWLKTRNVNYRSLLMDLDTLGKIELVKKVQPNMVWESDRGHARLIWKATRIPTLCFDTMEMFSR